ncbi:MAG TPA: putative glycoside hydrolase, partial [Anaerolineae bacterium]|nr:putative glycoside hydrolase [Anaerolineae bacterium]
GREPIIGQDLKEIAAHLDYLNPMIYPQVWGPETFTECGDPALCPYKVIFDSTAKVREIVPLPTQIRPWLQGYPKNYRQTGPAAGYDYSVPEYLIQRQAAEDAGADGWLFWSGGGRFQDEIFGPMPSLAELEAQIRARQGGRAGPY